VAKRRHVVGKNAMSGDGQLGAIVTQTQRVMSVSDPRK
jgi:hypothetical protein